MNRKLKKILALTLSVCIILGMMCVSASASDVPQYKNYVALGDGVAAGNTLTGYEKTSKKFLDGAYPTIIRDAVGGDGQFSFMGARYGMRLNELRIILEDDYEGDAYTTEFFNTAAWAYPVTSETLKNERDDFITAIRYADLITLDFGNNELYGTVIYTALKALQSRAESETSETLTEFLDSVINGIMKKEVDPATFDEVIDKAKDYGFYAEVIGAVTVAVTKAEIEFRKNWDIVIKEILELNSDVELVALGLFNPTPSKYSKLFDFAFKPMNNYIQYESEYNNRYIFVDISGLGEMISGGKTFDGTHPDYSGHKYIADQVTERLENYVHCTHEHTKIVNAKNVSILLPGYSGDVVCEDCGALIEQGAIVALGTNIQLPRNIAEIIAMSTSFTKTIARITGFLKNIFVKIKI